MRHDMSPEVRELLERRHTDAAEWRKRLAANDSSITSAPPALRSTASQRFALRFAAAVLVLTLFAYLAGRGA